MFLAIIFPNSSSVKGVNYESESLIDDTPIYSTTRELESNWAETDTFYFEVYPGFYTVIGVVNGEFAYNDDPTVAKANIHKFTLYSDENMTNQVGYTIVEEKMYNPINSKAFNFFVIDAIDFDSPQMYYAGVSPWEGAFGMGNSYSIEVETGNSTGMDMLSINSSVVGSMRFREVLEAYQVQLDKDKLYNISLIGDENFCFDLYLAKGNSIVNQSCNGKKGASEYISYFSPAETGHYCIIVGNPKGESTDFTLKIDQVGLPSTPVESTDFPNLFILVVPIALVSIGLRKYRKKILL